MAQLPDENVIALPQPGSRRPVSTIDVSGYARGAAAIGSGTETLGNGITLAANDVAAVLQKERQAADKLEYARAQAYLSTALINHGNAIEKEPDPTDLEQKYRTKFDEDVQIASRSISDGQARELFVLSANEHGARLMDTAKNRAFNLTRDAGRANDVEMLKRLSEAAIRSSDPNAVHMAVQSASDTIDGWAWIDRIDAVGTKQTFAQDLAAGKLDALPPVERYEALVGGAATRYGPLAGILPAGTRERMRSKTEREVAQARTKASYDAFSATQQTLDDALDGLAPLPSWESIQNNPHLQPADKSRARALYDTTAVEVAGFQRFMTRFKDANAGPFNPFDAEDSKYADKAFRLLGGNAAALEAVVSRTRILPKSAGVQLRGSMMSDDPGRVAEALTIAANLATAHSSIFIGIDGQSEFENTAVAFRHYVDTLGMTADEAARRVIRNRSPEYQANVQARLKAEDIDRKIRRGLTVGDLASEFGQVSWIRPTDPNVGFDPRSRQELFAHYSEEVRERYLETGDLALAKVQAADQLKRTWGVTAVNGSQTVMPYPPERAPAYAGIDNAADLIAAQAVEAIKMGTGEAVDRSRILLWPIPGVTAAQYKSGRTPSYRLMWLDRRGNLQVLLEDKAFEASPDALRKAQSREDEAAARRAVDAAERRSGITTTGDFGPQLQGGFLDIPEGVAVGSPPGKPREILPGIGDVSMPGGFQSQTPDAEPSAGQPYETFWMQGRGGTGFRGAVSRPPVRSPRNAVDQK